MKRNLFSLLLLLGMSATVTAQEVRFYYNESRGYEVVDNHASTNFKDLSREVLPWSHDGVWTTNEQSLVNNTAQTFYRPSYSANAFEQFDWITLKFTTPSYTRVVYKPGFNAFLRHYRLWRAFRIAYFDFGTDENSYWENRSKDPQGNEFFATALSGGDQSGTQWNSDIKNGESAAFYHYGDDNPYGYETRWADLTLPSVTIDNRNNNTEHEITRYGGFSFSKTYGDVYTSKGPNYINVTMYCNCDVYFYKYITFNANGGNGSMTMQTVENSANINANAFVKQGFTFVGWKDDKGNFYADEANVTATLQSKGPVTFYAQWRENPTILNADGTTINNAQANINSAIEYVHQHNLENYTIKLTTDTNVDAEGISTLAETSTPVVIDLNGHSLLVDDEPTDVTGITGNANVTILLSDNGLTNYANQSKVTSSQVRFHRDFAATTRSGKWQALYLPFRADVSGPEYEDYDFATLAFVEINNDHAMIAYKNMRDEERILEPNTPYLVRTANGVVDITASEDLNCYEAPTRSNVLNRDLQTSNVYSIQGSFLDTDNVATSDCAFWVLTHGGIFAWVAAGSHQRPYHWAIYDTNGAMPVSAKTLSLLELEDDNTATNITNFNGADANADVYTIDGRKVCQKSNLATGIYVMGTKKVMVK